MDNSRTLSKGRGVNHILTHKSIIPKYPLELNEEHSTEREIMEDLWTTFEVIVILISILLFIKNHF